MDEQPSNDVRVTEGGARFIDFVMRAGLPQDVAEQVVDGAGRFAQLLVHVLVANEDVAPNHITMGYDAGEERFEVTVRRHDGVTPGERIVALLAQLAELTRERDEARAREERSTRAYQELLDEHTGTLETLELLRATVDAPADVSLAGLLDAVSRLKVVVESAWEATGVAGQVRGLTALDDVIRCTRETAVALRAEVDKMRGRTEAARRALDGEADDAGR